MSKTLTKERRGSNKPLAQPRDDPDVDLMLRVRSGDEGAFGMLVERFWPRVFGHFIRMLGNRQDCEDCTQEVFLRIYRARKSYEPKAKFATWLFHVTQNVARNTVRARRRHPCVYLDTLMRQENAEFLEALLADRSDEPSLPVERDEVAEIVREAVARLGRRQRTAVELHQMNWTYNEVAEKMEMTPEAVKSLLYRARNQLRESLANYV